MRFLRFFLLLCILVIGWLIGWSNHSPIQFSFLTWQLPAVPVYILFFVFLFSGIVIGLLLGRFARRR